MKKIRFLKKPGYYNGTYPEGSVVMVDDNFADYVIGMKDAELAKESDKITDPTPYQMKPKVTGAEESLAIIAAALAPKAVQNAKT